MLTHSNFSRQLTLVLRAIANHVNLFTQPGSQYMPCTLDFDSGVLKQRIDIRDIAVWNDHIKR